SFRSRTPLILICNCSSRSRFFLFYSSRRHRHLPSFPTRRSSDLIGRGLSQAYLSQIENGARPHLTHTTRQLLARFFRVYPGFLVDDPEGYTPGLQSELRAIDAKIDSWLFAGAEQFTADPVLQCALLAIAE